MLPASVWMSYGAEVSSYLSNVKDEPGHRAELCGVQYLVLAAIDIGDDVNQLQPSAVSKESCCWGRGAKGS